MESRVILNTKTSKNCNHFSQLEAKLKNYKVIYIPSLKINAIKYSQEESYNINDYDIAIFLSKNAVKYVQHNQNWRQTKIIAVGPSTALAIKKYLKTDATYPSNNFSSAGIADMLALQDISTKKIVILTGSENNGLLAAKLETRALATTTLKIYKTSINYSSTKILAKLTSVAAITSFSCNSLLALEKLIVTSNNNSLKNCPLLVISKKMKLLALSLGFSNNILVADNATTVAVTDCLENYLKEQEHG